jgi:hypothetical protein
MPNFEAMLRKVKFDAPPEEANDAPEPLLRRADQARRFAALREADAILSHIPGPGETLHAIMTGRYDLADLIGVLIDKLGRIEHLRIATLAFSARNVASLKNWIEGGSVARLSMLCSDFFQKHNTDTFEDLRSFLAERAGHRMAASRSHCKVIGFQFSDSRFILEGSANLRTNSNWEQFALFRDDALHDFHAQWIDAQIVKHQGTR